MSSKNNIEALINDVESMLKRFLKIIDLGSMYREYHLDNLDSRNYNQESKYNVILDLSNSDRSHNAMLLSSTEYILSILEPVFDMLIELDSEEILSRDNFNEQFIDAVKMYVRKTDYNIALLTFSMIASVLGALKT